MKKIYVIGIIILLVGVNVSGTYVKESKNISTIGFDGNTLYVGGGGPGNYTRIQDAINASHDGDTIFVYNDSSPYYGHVHVNKTISLLGEDRNSTVIDGNNTGFITVVISSCGVNFSGFCIQHNYFGLMLSNSSFNIISNNCFFNTGVYIKESYHNMIFNNFVNEKSLIYLENQSDDVIREDAGQVILVSCDNITVINQHSTETYLGHWYIDSNNCKIVDNEIVHISLINCDNNTIANNRIHHYDPEGLFGEKGILLKDSNDNIISANNISYFDSSAINIDNSNNNKIINNHIYKNSQGTHISVSHDNNISNNIFSDNYHGMWLTNSHLNMIIGNKIVRQSDIHGNGIFMESCNYNSFIYNYFSNLFCGMDLKGSFSNYIYQNTFVKNIRNARIYECSILCNKWDRNYWNRPRLMPKIIFGLDPFGTEKEIWIDVDWHPAKQPYDIPKVTI